MEKKKRRLITYLVKVNDNINYEKYLNTSKKSEQNNAVFNELQLLA